ncbi:hypothetical protein B0H10DRAFT_1946871 [Mycena sp. CBHHK59/15]|nr:hypothetical protein B0H10DRAFT_1946871 [Mycena sp. CBHHK59/15]
MSNTSKAICAVSQQVDTLIRGLPEPTANDTPQTRNAWIRLLTRLRGTGTVISKHHDFDTNNEDEVEADLTKVNNDEMEGNQNANGNERQGREEDDDETEQQENPADDDDSGHKKRAAAGAWKLDIIKRSQHVIGEGKKGPISPDQLVQLITAPLHLNAKQSEDSAVTRLIRRYADAADGDWVNHNALLVTMTYPSTDRHRGRLHPS